MVGEPAVRGRSRSPWSIPTSCDRSREGGQGFSLGDDGPREDFAHWLVADIPPDVHELPEGAGGDGFVAHGRPPDPPVARRGLGPGTATAGSSTATLTSEDVRWVGRSVPAVEREVVHHYVTSVYALDVGSLGLDPRSRSMSSSPDRWPRSRARPDRPDLLAEPRSPLSRFGLRRGTRPRPNASERPGRC